MQLFTPLHLVILLLVGIPLLAIHFLPTIIARVRRTEDFWWIFLINFFLGWTVLGWIAALVWSLRDRPRLELLLPERRTTIE